MNDFNILHNKIIETKHKIYHHNHLKTNVSSLSFCVFPEEKKKRFRLVSSILSSLGVLDHRRSCFQVQKNTPDVSREDVTKKIFWIAKKNAKERLKLLPARGDETTEQYAELQRNILMVVNPSHNRPELLHTKSHKSEASIEIMYVYLVL